MMTTKVTKMEKDEALISLGKTDIQIPHLGVGVWAWGDQRFWNFGRDYGEADIRAAFDASLAAGVNFFDTAEMYGNGRSERFLGSFILGANQPVIVASKFFPFPWRLSKATLLHALRNSLRRLNLQRVDLYQIHWPFPPIPVETWAEAQAEAVQLGLTRAVGVSNYSVVQMQRASVALAKQGVVLASNQVEYSLLKRDVEQNGLLKACQELGVTLIAYSPLAQGILTGKYSPARPMPGMRGWRHSKASLEKVQPLLRLMGETGEAHGGKSLAQVALNWTICKGTVPIPGAKNARQAQDNLGALGWRLSEAEVAALDDASEKIK
jgi:aryl-alcohol dehydrogenase-like predicted oxidoreductase